MSEKKCYNVCLWCEQGYEYTNGVKRFLVKILANEQRHDMELDYYASNLIEQIYHRKRTMSRISFIISLFPMDISVAISV